MRLAKVGLFLIVLFLALPAFACDGELASEGERKGILKLPDTAEASLKDVGARAKGEAEVASVFFHQAALLEAFSLEGLVARGVNYRTAKNFREAIVKSDMGKLEAYKEWLTKASPESEALLAALRLQGQSPLAVLLRELNDGKPFLNPNLSTELLLRIFSTVPALVGYFHEFPGMRAAEIELNRRDITAADFREQILGIYGHNGPGHPTYRFAGEQPFWSKVPLFIGGAVDKAIGEGKLPTEARELFKGTVFESEGGHRYHEPRTAMAFEHMAFDRFDGYRDSRKIRNEVSGLYGSFDVEVEMLFKSGYTPTLAALHYNLEQLLPSMRRDGRISESEFTRLSRNTASLIARAEALHAEFRSRVENVEALLTDQRPEQITFVVPDASGAIQRVTFSREAVVNGEQASAFRQFIDERIRRPAMELDLERTGAMYVP